MDKLHIGPNFEDMVTFQSSSPDLAKREHISYVFKLSCLCLWLVVPKMPFVTSGCPDKSTAEVDLLDIIYPPAELFVE